MAAARDQAARVLRTGPDPAEGEAARDVSAALADQLRAHLSEETVARRPIETPASPATEKPATEKPAIDKPAAAPAAPAAPAAAAPKSGKRRLVLIGILALLALAVAGYSVYYVLVGRF